MSIQPQARRSRPRLLWIAVGIAFLFIFGLAAALAVILTRGSASASPCSTTEVADKTLPSVVTILVKSGSGGGNGSGSIIRSDGEILTNDHVISAAADSGSIEVVFSDGRRAPAKLVGRDSRTDLAVIKVSGDRTYPAIALASSGSVKVGQSVIALGAPLGLSSTVTQGIVSAGDRTIEVPSDRGQSALLVSAVQTDAAINPGNSGGALVDCQGRLVGVPTAGATVPSEGASNPGNIGLGFAIPVDLAKSISDQIISKGSVTHSFLGLAAVSTHGGGVDGAGGLYITEVQPGGPASGAGLRAGDLITKIGGEQATDTNQLTAVTITKKPGQSVEIQYSRGGHSGKADVVLTAKP